MIKKLNAKFEFSEQTEIEKVMNDFKKNKVHLQEKPAKLLWEFKINQTGAFKIRYLLKCLPPQLRWTLLWIVHDFL